MTFFGTGSRKGKREEARSEKDLWQKYKLVYLRGS